MIWEPSTKMDYRQFLGEKERRRAAEFVSKSVL